MSSIMYREYELRGDILVVLVYDRARFQHSHVARIRINVLTRAFDFTPNCHLSDMFVIYELQRLFSLLDSPHWRNFVNIVSNNEVDNSLF